MYISPGQAVEGAATTAAASSNATSGGLDTSSEDATIRRQIHCGECLRNSLSEEGCLHRTAATVGQNVLNEAQSEPEREDANNTRVSITTGWTFCDGDVGKTGDNDQQVRPEDCYDLRGLPSDIWVKMTSRTSFLLDHSVPAVPLAMPPVPAAPAPADVAQPAPADVAQPAPAAVAQPAPIAVAQPAPAAVAQPAPALVVQVDAATRAAVDARLAMVNIVANYDPNEPLFAGYWYIVTRGRTVGLFRQQATANAVTMAFSGHNWTRIRGYENALRAFYDCALKGGVTDQPAV
ncbi:hypothetical protein OH76DRAFT_1489282 [Lentinus brumalis]|uniref:Uncharacterized protein n=1 Tax=Lentinus brumalis TaxID=2498619 RepID=A0A371CN64_9APHY|nr:hypothetical protein OH76DRAFT_1489282 [Polyporus brumalis]